MELLIGVDIGTQGVKCVLFDREGRALSAAFAASRLYQPSSGITEEDPEFQYQSVRQVIGECMSKAGGIDPHQVAAIAIDGQMAGVIGIRSDGRAVTPYDSWLDVRCTPQIEFMRQEAADRVLKKTGCSVSINHGPKILWWKENRDDIYRQIRAFVQPAAYAAMRLCDLTASGAFIDRTYLHFSGFADNQGCCWDQELTDQFSIDRDKLPSIVKPQDIVGYLSSEAAQACGLLKGIPVAAGCGDTAASFLACGAVEEGICVDVAGTASVFAATTVSFSHDSVSQMLGCGASATEGLWHPYAYINGGGLNLEWFACDILGSERSDAARFARLTGRETYFGEDDVLFLPHMNGRVSPAAPQLRGMFANLSWSHRKEDMFRAIMESVALEYGLYKRALLSMLPESRVNELRITGGGEKSRQWKLMKSAVLQVPVTSVEPAWGAPMGSAMIAGVACGLFSSTKEAASSWLATSDSIQADSLLANHAQRRLGLYDRLLQTAMSFYQ